MSDWRKLERVFKTFNDIIDGEGAIDEVAREKLRKRARDGHRLRFAPD